MPEMRREKTGPADNRVPGKDLKKKLREIVFGRSKGFSSPSLFRLLKKRPRVLRIDPFNYPGISEG
jgi:hypothetical protein